MPDKAEFWNQNQFSIMRNATIGMRHKYPKGFFSNLFNMNCILFTYLQVRIIWFFNLNTTPPCCKSRIFSLFLRKYPLSIFNRACNAVKEEDHKMLSCTGVDLPGFTRSRDIIKYGKCSVQQICSRETFRFLSIVRSLWNSAAIA